MEKEGKIKFWKEFVFPEKEELKVCVADILEPEVDEKYYIADEKAEKLSSTLSDKHISNTVRAGGRGSLDRHTWDLVAVGASRGRNPKNPSDRTVGAPTEQRFEINDKGLCNTLTTVQKDNMVIEANLKQIPGNLYERGSDSKFQDLNSEESTTPKVFCPTLDAMCGGNRQPKILQLPRGKNQGGLKELSPTVTSHGFEYNNLVTESSFSNVRIRRLTALECWRLMGFDDEDFYKAKNSGVSDTQLYKQAGNSIVVNVLAKIFENLLK